MKFAVYLNISEVVEVCGISRGKSRKKRSQNRNMGESWQGTQRQMIRVVRREVTEKGKMEGKNVNCRWLE